MSDERDFIEHVWHHDKEPLKVLWKWATEPEDPARRAVRFEELAQWAGLHKRQQKPGSDERKVWERRQHEYDERAAANLKHAHQGGGGDLPARLKPNVVVTNSSVNQSSRAGARPRLIVLHSTESSNVGGNSDLAGVAGWFDNPAAQASAHVITDADGNSARCVADVNKAWACMAYNSVSLNIEQIGRAAQGSWVDAEYWESARWLAEWNKVWGIPLQKASPSGTGVVTHAQLGGAGGGHSDPGAGYDVDLVIERARLIRGAL